MENYKQAVIIAVTVLTAFSACRHKTTTELKSDRITEKMQSYDSLIVAPVPPTAPETETKDEYQQIIDNFYKYRDDKHLFDGLPPDEVNGYMVLAYSDDCWIFNFEKGTIRKVDKTINRVITDTIYRYINYIEGFPVESEIAGDFNGDRKIDSLKFDIMDFYDHADNGIADITFRFSDKTIPPLNVGNGMANYTIKNEGDLNGDGADEIGYMYACSSSACRTYVVYTLRRGKWREFISVETTLDSRALGIAPVENDPDREGYILVREPAVLSCQACAYIVEKNLKK